MTKWLPQWMLDQPALVESIQLGAVFAVAFVVYWVARFVLVRGIRGLVRRTETTWDDALVDAKVFVRLAHVAPALVVYFGVDLVPELHETAVILLRRVSVAVIFVVFALSANSFLSAVNDVYDSHDEYRRRPIKGYLQVVKIVITVIAAIAVLATLMDKSPWIFLSGLGAMTAVLLLIFRDTILSLVASVQIASNDMIQVGDWIEMPQADADGDVIDVALHTVKVQNWDKTITTIPTHKFIDDSFKNWRGMSLSGGRRIKRALSIDMTSVRFLSEEEVDRLAKWSLLSEYIAEKRSEIDSFNAQPGRDAAINADIRRLTNLGTLRAYIAAYLRKHPKIHESGYTADRAPAESRSRGNSHRALLLHQ